MRLFLSSLCWGSEVAAAAAAAAVIFSSVYIFLVVRLFVVVTYGHNELSHPPGVMDSLSVISKVLQH